MGSKEWLYIRCPLDITYYKSLDSHYASIIWTFLTYLMFIPSTDALERQRRVIMSPFTFAGELKIEIIRVLSSLGI